MCAYEQLQVDELDVAEWTPLMRVGMCTLEIPWVEFT